MLARYHSLTGDEHDPLIVFEMAQIRHALKLEKEAARDTSFNTLFATPGNRKRMVIIIFLAIFSQWRFGLAFCGSWSYKADVLVHRAVGTVSFRTTLTWYWRAWGSRTLARRQRSTGDFKYGTW